MTKLDGQHSKLHANLFHFKDEIAWTKLSTDDLSAIGYLRSIILPLSGMSMRPETLETIIKNEGLHEADDAREGEMKHSEIRKVVETRHAGLVDAELVKLGLSRFLLVLKLIKPKHLDKQRRTRGEAQARDAEARGEALRSAPGRLCVTLRAGMAPLLLRWETGV